MKKSYGNFTIIILMIMISFAPLFIFNYDGIYYLIKEDGFYENSSAVFYLLASGLMLFLFVQSKSEGTKYFLKVDRNYAFLLLGLFFFFCLGEEISWCQRILNIKTPENLQNINVQKEFNLHNIWIFEGYDMSGQQNTGLLRFINASNIYSLFWIFYCVILPILNYFLPAVRRISRKINLPVISVWIGFSFLLNYAISKILDLFFLPIYGHCIVEIKETVFGFLFLVLSISLFTKYKKAIPLKGLESPPLFQIINIYFSKLRCRINFQRLLN